MPSERRPLSSAVESLKELSALAVSGWLRVLLRELPIAKAIVGRRLAALCRGRPRRDSARRCMPVHAKVYRRPDPLIYSQGFLLKQGLAVTWDNPDIRIERAGVPVAAHALQPDTDYTIVARVWNGSTSAPAVHLPVRFAVLGFGIGTAGKDLGETHVDLGVKGSTACPVFASISWRTPPTPGHYCVQVRLLWSDDAEPGNNLGQTNTDVRPLNSPRARFELAVGNPEQEVRTVRLVADGYRLPTRDPCDQWPAKEDPAARRRRLLERHTRARHPVPEGWRVAIEPPELTLEPGEERIVAVTLMAPTDETTGRTTVNVNGFVGDVALGGVTLHAEGRADG